MVIAIVVVLALVSAVVFSSLNQNEQLHIPTDPWRNTTPSIPESYVQHTAIIIVNDTDLLMQADEEGWSGNGTESDPILIYGYHIESSENCITIRNVEIFIDIQECYLKTDNPNGKGVAVSESVNVRVSLCTIISGSEGVMINSSSSCIVNNCTIFANAGINFTFGMNLLAFGNIVSNSIWGFIIIITNSSEIADNVITDNEWGIYSQNSDSNLIHWNDISNNAKGIELEEICEDWVIFGNTILNNSGIGIEFDQDVSNISLSYNRLGLNGESNAMDNGFANHWDDGITGNYWSDFYGSGVYSIPGTAESVDHFPSQLVVG